MRSQDINKSRLSAPSSISHQLVFAAFALPSGAISASFPWETTGIFIAPLQPLAPPLYFTAALCLGLHHERSTKASEAAIILLGLSATWIIAYHAAYFCHLFLVTPNDWMPSQLRPQADFVKAYYLVIIGIIAGAIGSLGTSATIASIRPKTRNTNFFARTTVIGSVAGSLLAIPDHHLFVAHLALYLVWQPAVSWSIAKELTERPWSIE